MPEIQTLIKIMAILMAVCLVLSIIFHMPRATVVLVILIITVPMLCTIMWGDGTKYVAKIASLFTPELEQQINDGYRMYHDANAADPVVDIEQLESYMDQFNNTAKEEAKQVFPKR